ncbi:MAG: hypothetical protein DME26_01705 [Verrucomicrobia bacterium]|nr:MAG: hypothetical protein DME26_01705 [Verrucomicrobiota bacterium]
MSRVGVKESGRDDAIVLLAGKNTLRTENQFVLQRPVTECTNGNKTRGGDEQDRGDGKLFVHLGDEPILFGGEDVDGRGERQP